MTGARAGATMLEIKRTLDGQALEFPGEPLLVDPGVRVVLLCRIEEPEIVAGGRMTLQPGTLSIGHFWSDRPYNVYHWLEGEKTILYYVNIGRCVALDEQAAVWDDYAVDVLARPDGSVEVIDEDEIPATVDAETRRVIREATDVVVGDIDAIIAAVDAETRSLLAAR